MTSLADPTGKKRKAAQLRENAKRHKGDGLFDEGDPHEALLPEYSFYKDDKDNFTSLDFETSEEKEEEELAVPDKPTELHPRQRADSVVSQQEECELCLLPLLGLSRQPNVPRTGPLESEHNVCDCGKWVALSGDFPFQTFNFKCEECTKKNK